MLDKLLLIACVCIVIALILYFFYWNRFIAFVIGHGIRILFWNQEGSNIWIELGSIHFSLIAGRILLKDVRYHSSNQTMKIVKAQIQWRYWIRRPTSEQELNTAREGEVKHSNSLWSCRIQLTFEGVEWFLYNRTAAYDNIIEQIEKASRHTSQSSSNQRLFSRFTRNNTENPLPPSAPTPTRPKRSLQMPETLTNAMAWIRSQLPTLDPKDLLPLGIDIQTGAIILGNPSTPNLLVAEFRNAVGTFGIVSSKSKYDLYKQVLNLKFQNSLIRLVHNDDYVDPMNTIGALIHGRIKQHSGLRKPSFYQSYRNFVKLWRQNKLYGLVLEYFSSRRAQHITPVPSAVPFSKAKQTNKEDAPLGINFSTFEYAIERKILETPILELTYYVDVVGEVPHLPRNDGTGIRGTPTDTAPEWGFDLVIYGGFLRYGPWADRQRAELQRAFFPPTYLDSLVTSDLKPGEKRSWTALQVFVELRDETTLYIPFREASKDWQWDGQVTIPGRSRTREEASIAVSVGDRSSINYVMPMVVGPTGYESTLEVHLDAISITSSLNDIRLISAESCRVRCELPTPLSWNAERTWTVGVTLRQPVLYLLRDHINMITDLSRDWVSGPPTDYQKFIPMIYSFQLEMHHYELNLYANDHNIVDKPLLRDENALVTLKGPHFKNIATIPSTVFRPESNLIPFTITAPNLEGTFSLPRWNTHALYPRKDGIKLFDAEHFILDGSYRYFNVVMNDHIEQLKMDFDIRRITYRAFGWSIRYFMVLRDNYLGSFTHFQILSEYLDKRSQNMPVGDPIALTYRPGKANMLQAELSIRIENAKALIPIGLIGDISPLSADFSTSIPDDKCITLKTPEIQLQLRMHDYYMEMSLNIDTIVGTIQPLRIPFSTSKHDRSSTKEILMIDGIDIVANRLFGPQPRTVTYVCLWEISVGRVKTSMSTEEAMLFLAAGNSFRLNFTDLVNAPAAEFLPADDPDITFYKVHVESAELRWNIGKAVMLVELLDGVKFDSNDLGAHQYRKVTSLSIPRVSIYLLLTASLERNRWLEGAKIDLDIYLDMYASPVGHRSITRRQLSFIEDQDRLTGRARTMFNQLRQKARTDTNSDRPSHLNGVYIPQPTLPDLSSPSPTFNPSSPPHTSPPRPQSWKFSTLPNLTDSESEEGVSEADRDARLAKTRTSTPVPQLRDDDITMSSGDESDDADLTDDDSVGDDWSDVEDESSQKSTSSLLSFYSAIVKHYSSNWSSDCKSWDSLAFSLKREGASFIDDIQKSPDSGDHAESTATFFLGDGSPKTSDTTTIRIKTREPVGVVITPLVVPIAALVEEDIKNATMRPEMCIDSLLVDCLTRIPQGLASRSQIIDLRIPEITVQIIQHVSGLGEGNTNFTRYSENLPSPSNLDVAAVVNINLRGLSVASILGKAVPYMKVKLDGATSVIDTSIDKRTFASNASDPVAVELALSALNIQFDQHRLRTSLEHISFSVGNRGPELTLATAIALASTGKSLSKTMSTITIYRVLWVRNQLASILDKSATETVIDPLSTIQPSYLVQTGIPHLLRTDVTFRFLYHLRTTIWTMPGLDYLSLLSSHPTVDLPDFLDDIESRLGMLDQDYDQVSYLTMMNPLLFRPVDGFTKSPVQNPGGIPVTEMYVHVNSATVVVLAPGGGTAGRLSLKNYKVELQSRPCDLIQFNFTQISSTSQTSLRSKTPKPVRKTVVILTAGETDLIVTPHLMNFAQQVIRVKKKYGPKLRTNKPIAQTRRESQMDRASNNFSRLRLVEIIGISHSLRIQAAAENLVLVLGLNDVQTSSNLLLGTSGGTPQSMSHAIMFGAVYFQARSPADLAKESDQDILAALTFNRGHLSAISRSEVGSRDDMKLVFALGDLQLLVPRSALRLYQFIGEWRADYLPGMEATMKDLLFEFKTGPSKTHSPAPSHTSKRSPSVQIHGQVTRFEVSLQVMHGTWLSWEGNQMVAYFDSSNNKTARGMHAFGFQIASMFVNVSSKPNPYDVAPSSRIKVSLPPLSLAGHSSGHRVDALVLLDFIELRIKPAHWDTLLSVQQKFGQDFNDLVALMQKTRQNASHPPKQVRTNVVDRQYKAHMKMRGFRVGLEGISSVLLLECQDINGGLSNTNGWTWDLGLSDLALSLAPRVGRAQSSTSNRNHRSAFVTIDFKVNGSNPDKNSEKFFELSISKIHAVMQPSSIGELGDFIDNLQVEMLDRREQRASQLATFKEKARRILDTFDINADAQSENTSWIENLVMKISIRSIGVAFPLTHDEELVLPSVKGRESIPVQAFLFSVKTIDFGIDRGKSGQASMGHLSFQFVSKFRQSVAEDFSADKHQTRNCLYYPHMTARLHLDTSAGSKKLHITADVDGFVLDIDSTIPKYIFALIDVYREGKERMERLSTTVPRTPFSAVPVSVPIQNRAQGNDSNLLPPFISGNLIFYSGTVRLYSEYASDLSRTKILPSDHIAELPDHHILSLGAELFNLPSVSVSAEYRAKPIPEMSSKGGDKEPSMLMFNSTIHASNNVLRPTLLPFLTELVHHIETRMRKISSRISKPISFPLSSTSSPNIKEEENPPSSLHVCFSLRIDQSKLELVCQPDVNVVAGLHWESGGFVINALPGARDISFIGTVSGLTLGLKHGFLSEDCVTLDARNLTFSLSFSKIGSQPNDIVNSVSLILDTELFGEVHFWRFQDVLCFKAVWLDRIPLFNNQPSTETKSSQGAADNSLEVVQKRALTTMVLVRIREINVEIDLGQSITKINLELYNTIFRTKLTDDLKEVFLFIEDVSMKAQGNLSGEAHVPSCVFQTIRRSEGILWNDIGRGKMLELRLTSGALVANLISDYQQLLHYRAEPLEVEIFDDWSYIQDSKPLRLSFTVTCAEIVAAVTVSTLPKLLSYMNKFKANLDAQRQGAYRESQAFRDTRTAKADNPLSAVAEAMIHSARSRFKEADSGLTHVIQQHMSLRLHLLRLILFPRTMRDVEVAQFIGRDVEARLDGILGSDMGPRKRDLHLSFASMIISRYTQVQHPPIAPPNVLRERQDQSAWLNSLFRDATEAIIVGLPSMKMHMISEESITESATNLTYDFFSQFVRQDGMKAFEDIYITLNVSLYAWLTGLRKNLTREMEQVRATEDWRTSLSNVSSAIASGAPKKRKKVPDPLSLNENTRSSTLPSAGSSTLSPFPPSSARYGRMEQLLSPNSAREPSRSPLSQIISPALPFPSASANDVPEDIPTTPANPIRATVIYQHRKREIERLTMRQLGEATPDVMHPFFMKKAGFNLEDSLPQYVNEYAVVPLEEILEVLLKLYSQQLLAGIGKGQKPDNR